MSIFLLVKPLIQNDAVVLAILLIILGVVLKTSASDNPVYKRFYSFIPPILLCYFIPGILNTANIVSGKDSGIYSVASRYLLPASLVLLIMGVDLRELWKLRRKAGVMFLIGSLGIVVGGPLAILAVKLFAPNVIVMGMGEDATWRGLATIAGSWTGGSANMVALYEVFKPGLGLFSGMIALDVIVANIWLAALLYGVSKKKKINMLLNANNDEMDDMQSKLESYKKSIIRIPSMSDLMLILAIGLGGTGLAHFLSGQIVPWINRNAPHLKKFNLTSEFFWVIVISTTIGLLLSLTKIKKMEGAGASNIGSVFLYILIGTIGMQMNIVNVFSNPGLLLVGLIWISVHAILLLVVARILKINFFFVAVASQANIGGAPTASIVAAAFHPALVPVAVLLSVFGYAIGNYAGLMCALLMQFVSN